MLKYQGVVSLKRLNKFISFLLASIICILPAASLSVSAVTYPDGVGAAEALSTIPKLNKLVKTLLSGSGKGDIKTMVYNAIFSDSAVNSLFAGIYGAMAENSDKLSVIGVKLTPASLSDALSAYPDISKKVALCADLKAVIEASKDFKWKISGSESFVDALTAVTSPFNELLNVVLCSGSLKINNFISITGADGYKTAIVPLFTALNCPQIMSSATFAAAAKTDRRNIVKNITIMLFACIDKLLDNPITEGCSTLPKTAYYINSGKLSASIKDLLNPLSLKIAGIFTIPGISNLMGKAEELEKGIDLSSMLSSMNAGDFKLPKINMEEFAACGNVSDDGFVPDASGALITLLRYALSALRLNASKISASLGDAGFSPVINTLLSKSDDELIKIIITLLTFSSELPANPYQWNYPAVSPMQVSYTPNFTANEFEEILNKIDPLITEFIKESNPEGSVEKLLKEKIYSNALLSTIVKGIFSALDKNETTGLLSLLGLPVSPVAAADYLFSSYSYAARTLHEYSKWENVNTKALSWGFADGDRDAFIKALTKILSPFRPLLACLLSGERYSLFGVIDIPGADGYNSVIIPLLEALGCKQEKIKSYSEYRLTSSTPAAITDILIPIFSLFDEICASPVYTLCHLLPNIVYFVDNGLLTASIENLLYPIKAMLEKAGLDDLFSNAFGQLPAVDLNAAVADMLKSADLKIKFPDLDLKQFSSIGTPVSLTSKRSFSGGPAQYTYIKADAPAVILTLLRYFIGALTLEDNASVLSGLMGNMTGAEKKKNPSDSEMPDMFAMFAENISAKFEGMSVDEIIEWLYDLLFRETPAVEVTKHDDFVPTVIYVEEKHVSPMPEIILSIILIFAFAVVFIYLSKTGKLDGLKAKRQIKKEKKRKKKEDVRLVKAKSGNKQLRTNKPTENTNNKTKSETAAKFPASADNITKISSLNVKQAAALEKRQRKAEKHMKKNELKIRKQYEKALIKTRKNK